MNETLQTLAAFGLGTIVSTFVIFLSRLIYNKCGNSIKKEKQKEKDFEDSVKLIKSAMQAILRVEIRREYNEYYVKQKYIPMAEKTDFEYIWTCYHQLGKNGVMDDCHEKVMDLPTDKPQIIKNHRGPNR